MKHSLKNSSEEGSDFNQELGGRTPPVPISKIDMADSSYIKRMQSQPRESMARFVWKKDAEKLESLEDEESKDESSDENKPDSII